MEENVVDDGAFQPAPQLFNDVEIRAVRRQKFQVQPGIFLKKTGQSFGMMNPGIVQNHDNIESVK